MEVRSGSKKYSADDVRRYAAMKKQSYSMEWLREKIEELKSWIDNEYSRTRELAPLQDGLTDNLREQAPLSMAAKQKKIPFAQKRTGSVWSDLQQKQIEPSSLRSELFFNQSNWCCENAKLLNLNEILKVSSGIKKTTKNNMKPSAISLVL